MCSSYFPLIHSFIRGQLSWTKAETIINYGEKSYMNLGFIQFYNKLKENVISQRKLRQEGISLLDNNN